MSYVQDNFFAIGSCDPPFANVTLQLKRKIPKLESLCWNLKSRQRAKRGYIRSTSNNVTSTAKDMSHQ